MKGNRNKEDNKSAELKKKRMAIDIGFKILKIVVDKKSIRRFWGKKYERRYTISKELKVASNDLNN